MNPIRVAATQFNHLPGDIEGNRAIMGPMIDAAHADGVDLIAFPEMCITGYWHVRNLSRDEVDALAEPVPDGPSTKWLLERSSRTGMTIGAGLIERADDGTLYNTYVVAMPDGNVASHRKLHCFISEHMGSGDAFTVFDIPQGARVGVLICYDNNIPENARMTALQGAEILLSPHQTGGCNSRSPHAMKAIDVSLWEHRDRDPQPLLDECMGEKGRGWLMRWLPARAHDNGMFLVFSNGVGRDDDEVRTGNAMVLDPYGRILAETKVVADDIVAADLDPQLRHMCTGLRWMSTRRPELYGPIAQPTGHERDTRESRFSETF